ncbi:MAG: 4-alpha-glucanotransferase, partial [Gemmatimonadetes bacterium]|nr:4-alpha-glucanotransferase [Gemmatimonadota bacterium]
MSTRPELRRDLHVLAHLPGVLRWYRDIGGVRRHASPEALFLTLRALGAPLDSPRNVTEALAARHATLAAAGIEPVHVAWVGRLARLPVRLPARTAGARARVPLR